MADTVKLIMPDGQVAAFKKADADFHVKEQGWLPVTPENLKVAKMREDAGSLGGQAKAFLEGGARGLSAGFSDALEAKAGVNPEVIKARRAANPITSTLGEIGGGVGLGAALLTGAGEAGLGALGGAVAAGGVQGALNGTGSTVSESVLENKPLTAENLASSVAVNAILGGAGGAAGHYLGGMLGKAGRAVRNLPAFAEEQAVREAGASGATMEKLQKAGRLNEVGRALLNNDVVPGKAQQGAQNLANQAADAGTDIGTQLANGNPSDPKYLAFTFKELANQDSLDKFSKPYKKILARYAQDFELRDAITPDELATVKKSLDEYITSKGGAKAPKDMLQARAVVNNALENAVQDPLAYRAAKQAYGSAKEAAKVAKGAVANDLAEGPAAAKFSKSVGEGKWTKALGGLAGDLAPDLAKTADYVGSLSAVQHIANFVDNKIVKGLAQLTTQSAASRVALPSVGDYDKLSAEVDAAAQDPAGTSQRVIEAVGPDVAAHQGDDVNAAILKAQAGVAYLKDQMPRSPLPPGAMDSQWTPPGYVKAQWLDKHRAVMNPWSVASHPTEDSLAALKVVYPETYQQIINKLQENLINNKSLTYQQKLKISRLTGPGMSTMTTPDFVDTMQQVHQANAQANADQGQQGSARNAHAKQMNFKQASQQEATMVNRFEEN